MVGLAWPDTRAEMEVASLCSRCHRSWFSPVIPVPKQHIVQFGYVPSSIEFDHVLLELREEETELEALDEEVGRLEDVLFRMRIARAWLLDRMKQRRSVVSAVRRVPVEIWDMILKWASSMTEFSLDFSVMERNKTPSVSFPHTLSRVCRGWKRMVDAMPTIWCSIRIAQLPYLRTDIRPLLVEYLSKSSGHPLKISVLEEHSKHYASPHYRGFLRPEKTLSPLQQDVFLLLIRDAAVQCEELEFYLSNQDFPLNSSDVIEFPILQSLRTEVPAESGNKMYGWLCKILKQSPHLTRLSARKFPYLRDIPRKENLTVLEIKDGDMYNLPKLLRVFNRLESLTVNQLCLPDRDYTNLADIEPPHLRTLHLTIADDPSRMSALFDHLRATSLTDLRLSFDCRSDYNEDDDPLIHWPQTSFVQMLGRHASSITRLDLEVLRSGDEPMPEELSLAEIVQAVPRLTYLKLGLEILEDSDLELALRCMSALKYRDPGRQHKDVLWQLKVAIFRFQRGVQLTKKKAQAVAKRLLEVAESRTRDRLDGVDGVMPMSTVCVALGDMDDDDYYSIDSERWSDTDGETEDGDENLPSWSALVGSRAMTERARAVKKAGIRCFFGGWEDFESMVDCRST
ncbi:hypothetical protein PQX77_012738 [Marasmius sp. AFHP31]|nr:hypothetical protein PQX77_012738 [Marasmius sp. AFHP31]